MNYSGEQVLNQCLDRTDVNNPALRTSGGGGGGGTVTVGSALPAGTNNIGDVDVASLPAGSLAGATAVTSDYDTGAGAVTTPMVGLALPGNGGPVQGGTSTNPIRTDPTGTTTQPVSVASALPAGTNNIGFTREARLTTGGGAVDVSVGTSSTSIVTADANRDFLVLHNRDTSVSAYLDHDTAATTTKGMEIKAGERFIFTGAMAARAWNGIVTSGSVNIRPMTGAL